jgi:predicted amidohydrolase
MRLCIAQTKPVTADIEANIQRHKQLIGPALEESADTIIFPELSLTGYEPSMARELACEPDDNRFDEFQRITDDKGIVIGVGIPTKGTSGTMISTILFQPRDRREIYSKNYLHRDEV